MTNSRRSLDDLIINPEYRRSEGRRFTRAEALILGWLVKRPEGRTYREMMRECSLDFERCQQAIEDLLELEAIVWR